MVKEYEAVDYITYRMTVVDVWLLHWEMSGTLTVVRRRTLLNAESGLAFGRRSGRC